MPGGRAARAWPGVGFRHSRLFGNRFKTLVESEAGQEQFKIVARRAFSERF